MDRLRLHNCVTGYAVHSLVWEVEVILVVTGSRSFESRAHVRIVNEALADMHNRYTIDVLLTGRCPRGADYIAEIWAETNGVQLVTIPANWQGPDGLNAGKERNTLMLDIANHLASPNRARLVAFVSACIKPGCPKGPKKHWSHGTKDCYDKAIGKLLRVKHFTDETLI